MQTVLFGAGVYAKKYKSLLDFLEMPFEFFTDNDPSKWGTELYGKPVIAPNELVNLDCQIVISCTHGEQITRQLEEMGLGERLLSLEMLYHKFSMKLEQRELTIRTEMSDKRSVIIDMYEGIGWGGTEIWATTVGAGLQERGETVFFIGSTEQEPICEDYEQLTQRFSEKQTLELMITSMIEKLPFVLINNFAGCAYLAAVLLKMQYPQAVKIVDVIHNDNVSLFNAHMIFSKWVDAYICVSDKIRREILSLYTIEDSKAYFKEQPIEVETQYTKVFGESYEPIRIGYAARIVKQQKRTDLFPELISELEKKQINYILTIAGDGECLPAIQKYINRENLADKVHILGRIPKAEMSSFWKQQDIFLNFSEYEGTSLSMLEAMGYACVPIVTLVSGVSEFIVHGENGYISSVGDLKDLAAHVKELDADREKVKIFGLRCRDLILQKCNKSDYIDYIMNILSEINTE